MRWPFECFGVNLMSLRICVFLFFLAWLPAVYYIALRFTSALAAGAITLLAVAWSYPNYPAAMPSWYNLFFATFGAAALLRYLEVRTRRWLFVAGVCGGVSILIKVIGAYYIAGVLLFLAFLEQSESSEESAAAVAKEESSKNSWPYRVFSVSALLLFLATLVGVLRARLGAAELYQFVLPSAVVVGLILLGEAECPDGHRPTIPDDVSGLASISRRFGEPNHCFPDSIRAIGSSVEVSGWCDVERHLAIIRFGSDPTAGT